MPEVDEFGIPIKKTSIYVDEFGIPIKKKDGTIEEIQPTPFISRPIIAGPIDQPKQQLPLFQPIVEAKPRNVKEEAGLARERINNVISGSDDIFKDVIREGRLAEFERQQQTVPSLDNIVNPNIASARKFLLTQDIVRPEDISEKRNQAISDPVVFKEIVSRASKKDPLIARSAYILDAESRIEENPEIESKIASNAQKISDGSLIYNTKKGVLQEPKGAIESAVIGFQNRGKQLDSYEKITSAKSDKELIDILESEMSSFDPDKPIPIPEGSAAQFAEMFGMEGVPMLKGSVAAIATSLVPGLQGVAPYVASFAASPEYYKRSYDAAIKSTYYELRKKGKSKEEALEIAKDQANKEGLIGAAEGIASTALGAKIGFKTPKVSTSPMMQNAIQKVLTSSANAVKSVVPEAATDAAAAGILQIANNLTAIDNGLDRGVLDGVQENVAGEVMFTIGMGALTKGGRTLIDRYTYKSILNSFSRQPKDVVDAKIGEMVVNGDMTPEDAIEIGSAIDKERNLDSQIPDNVKEDNRPIITGLIENRDQLKGQLKSSNEAFHPQIKEQIKLIDNQILNYATQESAIKEGIQQGGVVQPAGVEEGQPEVGQAEGAGRQATQPKTDVGYRPIGGEGTVISLAPFFDTKVKNAEEANALRQTPEYKRYLESIPVVAKTLGLNVQNINETIGGFENKQGDKIVEISNRVLVDSTDLDKVERFAAIMGTMTPETQEATIAAKYVSKEEVVPPSEYVEELTISVNDVDKTIESLQEAGIYDFTIDEGAKTVSFLDFSKGEDVDFDTKVINFEQALQKRNVQYEGKGRSAVRSKYVSPERRTQLIAEIEGDAAGLQQGGPDFRAIVSEAKQRDKAFRGELTKELTQELVTDPISKAAQSLKATGISIDLIEDPTEYDAMVERLGGKKGTEGVFLSNEGRIVLNKSKLNNAIKAGRIVWHESSHPVINIVRNTNPDLYNRVISGMKASDNPAVQRAIQWANDNYQGQGVIDDESIVEAIAMVADGTLDLNNVPTSLKQSIIDFINLIARALGFGQVLSDTDIAAFKKLAGQVADVLTSGRDVAEVVGRENIGKFKNELVQQRITAEDVLKKEERGDKKVIEVADAFEKAVDDVLDPQSDPKSRITRFLKNAYEDLRYFLSEYKGDTGLDWYTNKVKEFNAKLEDASDIAIRNGEMPEANSLRNPDNMDVFKVVLALSSIGINPRENVKAAFNIWKTFNQETKTFSKYQPGLVSLRTNIPDGKGGYSAPSGEIIKDTAKYLDLKQKNGKVIRIKKSDLAKEFSVTYKNQKGKEVTKNLRFVRQTKNATVYRSGPSTVVIKNDDILDASEVSDGIQGKGWTTKGNIVAINLVRLENLLADHPDLNSAIKWINDKHPINELRKYNSGVPDVDGGKGKINPKGERLGSYIIGEKLGAFHQNVAGTPTELTMDLWWSRTWNRYMGTLIGKDKDGQPIIQETPRTDNERNVMREAAKIMADSLGLEVHELQAALWYLEQQMYKRMGAAVESYSFVDGINELLLQYGKSGEEIQPERYGIDSSEADQRRTDAAARAANILYGESGREGQEGSVRKERPIQASVGNRDIINGFYSPIEDRINTFKQPKASVQKWKDIVGMKSDEAVFSGMAEWLGGMKPDRQLSKEEVLKFMKDNRIEIKVIDKSLTKPEIKPFVVIDEATEERVSYFKTEEEAEDYIRQNSNRELGIYDTESDFPIDNEVLKYSSYQLPGGDNYKEVLITVPNIAEKKYNDYKLQLIGKYGSDFKNKDLTSDEFDTLFDLNEARKNSRDFKSSHFDEYNIITHLRMNTRTDADGKKVLFLEEVQSDWGQKGKKEGFSASPDQLKRLSDIRDRMYKLSLEQEGLYETKKIGNTGTISDFQQTIKDKGRLDEIKREIDSLRSEEQKINKGDIPSAPYVTNTNAWVKLGLKVALKEAVKQGADRIAWTTGDQQNERYDLRKQVDSIAWEKDSDGTYAVTAEKNGRIISSQTGLTPAKIEEAIGKDAAEKIVNSADDNGVLEGNDLAVGGKGMKAFYGDAKNTGIVGNVAKALVKELTGKEGQITESVIRQNDFFGREDQVKYNVYDRYGRLIRVSNYENYANSFAEQNGGRYEKVITNQQSLQPAIDITPELAQSVQQGMPQFSVGNRPENNPNFKLGAFVMRKKAEGATDREIAIAIASVTVMKPEDIKTLIDNPEQYIRDMFPSMTKLQQDNLIQKAKIQNIYRGRQFGKPIDKAFTGLEVPQEYVDEYMNKTAKSDNAVKEWATDFKRKWLDPAKGLPDWVLAIKDFASGSKNIEIARASKTIEKLKEEAKKIGFTDWNAFGKALVVAKDVKRYIPNEDGIVPFDLYKAAANKMFAIPDDMLPTVVPDEIKALPDEIIPYVYAMRGQIDGLTRDLIGYGYVTPEQAVTLENNIGAYVNRSYRMFNEMGYKPEPEVMNAAIKFLADDYVKKIATDKVGAVRDQKIYEEAIDLAKKDVDAILNKKKNPYFNANVNRRNTGILQERKDIPEPLRKLMGEYTDPGTVFMMTVAKQAALKASSEYLNKIRTMGMGTMFFEKDDPSRPLSHNVQIASTGTESMNPLGGLFTTPEIAEAIDMAEPTYNELTQAWMKLVGLVRWGKTVGSIATQFKNFESNLGFAVLNGYLMSGQNTPAFKAAGKYVKGQYSKAEIDSITEKAIILGLVGQSVGARELKEMLGSGDVHDIALDIALSPEGKWGKKVAKKLNIFREANKLYRLGDDFWKVYSYMIEREQLSDARFSSKYEDLTKEQKEQIDIESSERVKNTWPTYDRVVEGAKYVSKRSPIFGNFISFQAESLRVLANSIKLAKQDMADPQLRHLGVRRAVGIAAYFGLRSAITIGLAKMAGFAAAGILGAAFGDDEEERNKRAIKQALPPFMRTSDLAVIRTKEPHKFTVISLSSIDPYAIIPNSLNAYTEGREGIFGKTMDPGVGAATAELFSAFLEPEMTFSTMWSVMNNIDPKTKQEIVLSSDSDVQAAAKIGVKAWDMLEPSSVALFQRLFERKDKESEILALGGARPYDIDLHKSFGYMLSQFAKDVESVNSEYNRIKYKEGISNEDREAAEKVAEDKKAFLISKLNENYRDFINIGANPIVLNGMIKDRTPIKTTGFDKHTKRFIKTGNIQRDKLFK